MSDEIWRPVFPADNERSLIEEFPGFLRESTFPWLKSRMGNRDFVSMDFFVDFQNATRKDYGFKSGEYESWTDSVLPYLRGVDNDTFTNILDYALSRHLWNSETSSHPIERVLSEGGSAWTIIVWKGNHVRLAKRVEDGVREVLQEVLSAADSASLKLQEAWLDAFGANPRASVAYGHAVVAVETAALSVIQVSNPEPTLANLFSILEADTPKWRLVLRDSDKAPGGKTLAAMLRTLWRGHESRHGRPDYRDATLEEARTAVILAATLVQWFTSGAVCKV